MTNFSKLFEKTKLQLLNYLKHKTIDLSSAQRRCVEETSYGILKAGDVTLTSIARSLNENLDISKTVDRLSVNLSKQNFSEKIEDANLENLKHIIDENSIIVVDDSDIIKPRAKVMEGLTRVHDGSTNTTGNGFNLTYACLVSKDRDNVKTLTNRLHSTLEKGYISNNDEHEKLWRKLIAKFDGLGVYVMDRGFRSLQNMRFFNEKANFVIREGDRKIVVNGKEVKLMPWANRIKLNKYLQITSINKDGVPVQKDVAFTVRKITIGDLELNSVIMKLEDHSACVLVTNQSSEEKEMYDFGKMVIEQYGCRWSVEEKIRFEKQQFNYENIRVRSLNAIKNMLAIVGITSSFVAHLYWQEISVKIIEVAKVIKSEVRFEFYRIAEGLKRLFELRSKPVFKFGRHHTKYFRRNYQYELWEIL